MLKKHLIYIILNSCFVLLSIALPWFGQGYTFLVYVLSLIFLLTQVFKVFDFKTNYSWFVFGYLILFYISPIFEFFYIGEVLEGSEKSIGLYHLLNISSIHIFSIFYFISYRVGNKKIILISKDRFDKVYFLTALVTFFASIWIFLSVGGFSAINSTRVDLKYIQGGKIYSLWLLYFSSSFFFLMGIKFLKSTKKFYFLIGMILALSVLEFIYFVALRNRTMILMHLIAIVVGGFVSSRIYFNDISNNINNDFKKINFMPLLWIMGGLASLGIFIRFARGVYLEGNGNLEISWKEMLITSVKSGDFGYANMVIRIIDHVYYTDLMLNGQSYYRLLLAFIPDSIYSKNIITTDSLIGQMLTGLDVMTIPPGIFGDSYLNFGMLGFVMFIFYGLIFGFLDKNKNYLLAYMFFSLSFTLIYHFVRGSFVNVVISLIIIYIGCFFVVKFLRPKYI